MDNDTLFWIYFVKTEERDKYQKKKTTIHLMN
jgi:hypothetical protein